MGLVYLEKQKVTTDGGRFKKWCACCGIPLKDEMDVIRFKDEDGRSKIVLVSHLLSWLTEEPSLRMTFTYP